MQLMQNSFLSVFGNGFKAAMLFDKLDTFDLAWS